MWFGMLVLAVIRYAWPFALAIVLGEALHLGDAFILTAGLAGTIAWWWRRGRDPQAGGALGAVCRWLVDHWPVPAGGLAGLAIGKLLGADAGAAVWLCLILGAAGLAFEHFVLRPPAPLPEPEIRPSAGTAAPVEAPAPKPAPPPAPRQVPPPAEPLTARRRERREERVQERPRDLPAAAEYYRFLPDPAALDAVIGLDEAKGALLDAMRFALRSADDARLAEFRVKPPKGILLYGPPGTGKTSFARAAARRLGCHFVVVNASAVAGPYVGQTEQNIRGVFSFAKAHPPCVIFFDEFDAIARKRGTAGVNSPSDLAINVLLAEMDGFSGAEGVVVIAATNRIEDLDPALLRPGRFDVKVEVGLPDEAAREKLFALFLKGRPHAVGPEDLKALARESEGMSPAEIEAVVNEAARTAAVAGVSKIYPARVREALQEHVKKSKRVRVRSPEEVWRDIDGLVGLAPVKAFLKEVEAVVLADRERREKGLPPLKQALHMAFLGNPGTGKTTVARLVGELFAALRALPSGHLVETDRSGLVAGYVGQTALKVQEKVRQALGGVLFVDEAYSLARGGPQDFGAEALDALVKAMEDHRDKLCVVLAGYTGEMEALFRLNPGLESRIAFACEFPDYSPEELVEIARLEAAKRGFSLTQGAEGALLARFRREDTGALGNGRHARKLVEAAVRKAVTAGRINTLEAEDFT